MSPTCRTCSGNKPQPTPPGLNPTQGSSHPQSGGIAQDPWSSAHRDATTPQPHLPCPHLRTYRLQEGDLRIPTPTPSSPWCGDLGLVTLPSAKGSERSQAPSGSAAHPSPAARRPCRLSASGRTPLRSVRREPQASSALGPWPQDGGRGAPSPGGGCGPPQEPVVQKARVPAAARPQRGVNSPNAPSPHPGSPLGAQRPRGPSPGTRSPPLETSGPRNRRADETRRSDAVP